MASGSDEAYTVDEAWSRLGFGRFQALLLVLMGTGKVAEAMETMLLSFVGPSVKAEWGVSAAEEGLVTSVVFAGTVVGSCVGGFGSDRYGRRTGVLVTALITAVSGFLCAFSPNYPTLLALRFVVGIGLGASYVLSIWFLEFVPAESRGSWMAGYSCLWTLGTMLEALLAWVVMPKLGWRWLLALTSLPYFILLIFCSWIPESPRYLCLKGDISEAMLILERIARINGRDLPPGILISEPKRRDGDEHGTSITAVLLMPEDRLRVDDGTSNESNIMSAIQPLWSRDLIRPTVLLWLVKFAGFFAYYSTVFLTSELSNGYRSCASTGVNLMQPEDSNLYIDVLVTSFAEFPGHVLVALLVDRFGRRLTLGGTILLCSAFVAPLSVQLGEGLAITLLFCARACIDGSFVVLLVYSPEIYPTSCRNTGVGIANCIGQVGSIVAPLVTITLVENCRQEKAVLVMDQLLFFAGVACALFPHETKGREIQ